MDRGFWPTLMVVLLTVMGLTNFFVPIFVHDIKTDPVITYIFMGTASSIAGFKGMSSLLMQRIQKPADSGDPGPTKEPKP